MKKWLCTVCGYVHTGDEPPEKCPVCGADKSKFIELSKEEAEKAEAEFKKKTGGRLPEAKQESGAEGRPAGRSSGIYGFISHQLTRHHAHPVSSHVPNGVLPAAVVFLVLGLVFELAGLEKAAFYNLVFVVLAMPFVLFSGYNDWQNRYRGELTSLFLGKMVSGVLVLIIGLFLVVWRLVAPESVGPDADARYIYLMVQLIMLSAAGVAGYLGGKLVFGE